MLSCRCNSYLFLDANILNTEQNTLSKFLKILTTSRNCIVNTVQNTLSKFLKILTISRNCGELWDSIFSQMNIFYALTIPCRVDSTPYQASSVVEIEWDLVFQVFFRVPIWPKNACWNQPWKHSHKIQDFCQERKENSGKNEIQPSITTYRRPANKPTLILGPFPAPKSVEILYHRIGKIFAF